MSLVLSDLCWRYSSAKYRIFRISLDPEFHMEHIFYQLRDKKRMFYQNMITKALSKACIVSIMLYLFFCCNFYLKLTKGTLTWHESLRKIHGIDWKKIDFSILHGARTFSVISMPDKDRRDIPDQNQWKGHFNSHIQPAIYKSKRVPKNIEI